MQTVITIPLPKTFSETREARAFFSKSLDELIPGELFNHAKNGSNLQCVSPFRFAYLHQRQELRLVGIGHNAMLQLFNAFQSILGAFPESTMNTGSCSLIQKPYLQNHEVKSLILSNTHSRSNAARLVFVDKEPIDSFKSTAEEIIRTGVSAQLELLDQELPDDFVLGDVVLGKPNTILRGKRHLTASAKFRCNYFFQGFWHVGKFVNLGHGRII